MKKVLFIPGGKMIAKMFVDIIKELKDPNYEVLVINRDHYYKENTSEIFGSEGIPTKGLETYKTKDVRKILRLEKPSIIVVGHDSSAIERSFILGGKYLEIPSLLIQDGIINLPSTLSTKESIFGLLHLLRYIKIVFQPSLYLIYTCGMRRFLSVFLRFNRSHNYGRGECSKVAVMSPYAKNVFTKLGFNANNLIITGQPRFDELFNPKFTRYEVCKKINLSPDKDIALLAAPIFAGLENGDEKRKIFIEAVAGEFNSFENTSLVIKVHPGLDEKTRTYKKILRGIKCDNALVVKDFDVPSLVNACTLFLSHYSTMAMEALILGKPVIIINMFGDSEYYPFVSSGAAISVHKAEDIATAVESILTDEVVKRKIKACRDRFVYEHAYKTDGEASKRVANLIKQVCEYR
jgi:predicted glycosyltransferase